MEVIDVCPVCGQRTIQYWTTFRNGSRGITRPNQHATFQECTSCWMFAEGEIPKGDDYEGYQHPTDPKTYGHIILIGVHKLWSGVPTSIAPEHRITIEQESRELYNHPNEDVRMTFRAIGDNIQDYAKYGILADAIDDNDLASQFPRTYWTLQYYRSLLSGGI